LCSQSPIPYLFPLLTPSPSSTKLTPTTVSVLLINAIAILSEDRFLARIGWSASSATEPAFGAGAGGDASVKAKIINLITSIRTLMRSMLLPSSCFPIFVLCDGFWNESLGRIHLRRKKGDYTGKGDVGMEK
jgi:hypothetical protein